ncbi:ABC transporter substrate-binding protein [Arthrobacter sp. MYb23]|uniref:extracellular solute-binding protein n=1 Tax=unclassified Arthrobacter TaxID=235627 RepID=UPI000CFD8203|nr:MULTISPECIES: extracellular solute-binding protein [unclassified Arthrobacter]PRB43452.1 ABC transporter substrate-binding protein [Arthrobacter sp. MYb51]PRB93696.1 ABC transporter substrate-binding protein [Arthrobacter sp. MYb23]
MPKTKASRFHWKPKTALTLGVLGALALSGCTPDGSKDESGKPVVTVQVVKDSRAKAMSDMPWTKDLETACGCTIQWQETASSSWTQQRQASLAAGEVADVTIGGYGSGDWGDYSSLFMDLSPELENLPNLSKTFEASPYSRVASTWDDKLFGAPGVNTGLMANSSSHMFINKKWLDKLGLPVPTTWGELKRTLEAFKKGDPNGDGKPVTPLTFNAPNADGWGWFQPNVLLGSHGIPVTGGGQGMYAENGTIKNYLTDPAYKDLANYLHDLWSEGLISNEAFTQDWSKYTATTKGEGTTAKVGVTWMWTPSDIFGSQLADQYVTIPQLKADDAPNAKPVWFFNGDQINYSANKVSVAANVKNKDAALKLVDAMYTSDIGIQMRFGSFGVGVKKNGEKDYTILSPTDTTKNASDWQFQNSLSDGAPGWFLQPGVKLTLPKEQFEVRGVDEVYKQDLANMDLNKDVIYGGVSFTADENKQYSLNNTGITQTAMSKFAQWVTKGGADQDWDAYVAALKKNGLDQQVSLQQAAYDRYVKVMQDNKVDLNIELNNPDLKFTANPDNTATITNSK